MTVRFDMPSNGSLLATYAARTDMRPAIRAASVVLLAALTAAAAQISIPLPFTPVPFTLQPMVVLLGGAALGARLGMAAQVLYLVAGLAGLPVFAASAVLPQGALRLLGPTGGYLMSYPFAAFVTGSLAERGFDRRYLTSVIAMACGLLVVFACGVTWLALFAKPAAAGFSVALKTGLYPFVVADVIKLFIAAGVMPALWAVTGRANSSSLVRNP
jgi:biotin transport system substrate-specific component